MFVVQIRSFITKNLKDGDRWKEELETCSVSQLMEQRPAGYQPPPMLSEFFEAHAAGRDPMDVKWKRGASQGEIDPAATTSTDSLLSPDPGKPDFNLLLSIAAGVSTHSPEEISTRVPASPPRGSCTLAGDFKPMQGFAVFTEVGGQGNSKALPTILAMEKGEDSMDDSPLILASSNSALNSKATAYQNNGRFPTATASAPTPINAKEGARHVRWGANVEEDTPVVVDLSGQDSTDAFSSSPTDISESAERSLSPGDGKTSTNSTNSTNSTVNSFDGMPSNTSVSNNFCGSGAGYGSGGAAPELPSLRNHMASSNLPPPPAAAPNFMYDPLKGLLTAAQHQEAMQIQQQMHAQFIAEQQRNQREESALAGLEAYNLECMFTSCVYFTN